MARRQFSCGVAVLCGVLAAVGRAEAEEPYEVAWVRQLGTWGSDYSLGVSADGLGNVYMSGRTTGSLCGSNEGWDDAFLSKYDAAGTLLWSRQFGTSETDYSFGVSADGLGNVYVSGSTDGSLAGPNAGDRDVFLAEYDAAGTLLWSRQLGTSAMDRCHGVSADGLGNVYIAGETYGSLGGANLGESDVFVAKYDGAGTRLWTRQLGTSAQEWGGDVSADGLGNVYVSGQTYGPLGGAHAGWGDAFVSKYDAAGTLLWTRQLATSTIDASYGVSADGLGNVYISGETWGSLGGPNAGGYDAFVAKYNAAGTLAWTRQLGTTETDFSGGVSADGLGNVYISGATYGSLAEPNAGYNDAFVSKYDAAGTLLWTRQLGTSSFESSEFLSADGLGNVYISGETMGSLGGPNAGDEDAFVAKLVVAEPFTLSSVASGDWSAASTWDDGTVTPQVWRDVVVGGHEVTLAAHGAARSLRLNDAHGAVLLAQSGTLAVSERVQLTAGTLAVGGTLHAGSIEVAPEAALSLAGTLEADSVNLNGGALHLAEGAHLNAATVAVCGGMLNTWAGHLVVSQHLSIGDDTTFRITGATFEVKSSNLADEAQARNLTLSGGTLTIGGGLLSPEGAIAIWKFGKEDGPGTATDSSVAGNDHLGTLSGVELSREDPDHPTALRFDRDDGDDYVEVANAGDILFSSPFTIAMWIKTSDNGVELFGKGNGDGKWKYFDRALCVEPGTGQIRFTSPLSGSVLGSTAVNVANDEWRHVVVTFNGSTAPGDQEIYVDTLNCTDDRFYAGGSEMGEVVRLGSAETTELQGYRAYDGLIDDVYLYDRSLSAAEVADLYQAFSSVLDPMPKTNLRVRADSTLSLETAAEEATLGNLVLDPGVALKVTGAPLRLNDATVGDRSSIEGDLRLAGSLSPGDGPAGFSVVGRLQMDGGSSYLWELGKLTNDVVAVDGTLNLAEGWIVRLGDAGGTCAGHDQIDLFTCTGSLTIGSCLIDGSEVASSGRWDWSGAAVHYDQNRVYLTGLTVVPEPRTLMILLSGATLVLCVLWRRVQRGSSRLLPL